MKPALSVLLSVLALLLALPACSSKPKPKDVTYDGKLQPNLPIPSYSRNALDGWPEGREVDPYDVSRVRLPEEVHTYYIGRLPSYDRREMNEAHSVYRVEQNARWDQRMPATPMASRGVVFGIREPTHDSIPKDDVVLNERAKQVEMSQRLQDHLTKLAAKQEEVEAYLISAPDKNKTIEQLSRDKSRAEKELADLKADYKKMKEELTVLRERQAMQDEILKSSINKSDSKKP